MRSAVSVIRKSQPDIIHFNFTNPLVMPFAKLLGVPLSYRTGHTAIPQITARTKISRMMTNVFMDRFFAVSECAWNYEILAGARKDKLFLNYLGLPIEDYAEGNIAAANEPLPSGWNDPRTRKIITVGRFFPEKGMDFVTLVAIETMHLYPDVIWWMVGGRGPHYSLCKEMVDQNHLDDRIIFLGQRNDVPALLRQSYMQVVGSHFEGLPLNVLESSILGVPTIGPNIKGLDEAIQANRTGFLIGTRTVEDFVTAIDTLLEDASLRNRMGENAKSFVIQSYNSSFWIQQLMNCYERDYSRKVNQGTTLTVAAKN
jgi:glycosyltransferase involved in cell wall biosynthesis